jgi:hypothetical protein
MQPVHGISVRIGMLTIDYKLIYIDMDLERHASWFADIASLLAISISITNN